MEDNSGCKYASRDADNRRKVERAETLLPRVRERADLAERLRHVPSETIQEFRDAGLFRVLQPKRWGGYELDYGRTQVELCNVLGQACGSSAWVQSVVACHAWCLAMFESEAQDAVWSRDSDTLAASAFAFASGRGRPVEGGYFIEGDWQFSSGSNACQWIILGTPIYDGDGPPRKMVWCLLPRPDWEVVDTWFAAGLRGSASNDIRVRGAFVPSAFTVNTAEFDGRPTPGSAVNSGYIYRLPLWSVFPYNVSTPALGIARGAIEAYVQYMGSRPERANMVQRQLRIAESLLDRDAERKTYRLGPRLARLGLAAVGQLDLASVARPFLLALAEQVGGSRGGGRGGGIVALERGRAGTAGAAARAG